MKFEQVKPGMILFDIDRELGFKARVYYLVFKKDSKSITLIEISETDAVGEFTYWIRKIELKHWPYLGLDKKNVIQKSQFFDTLFTEIKYLYTS